MMNSDYVPLMRLNKFLARSGVASRRGADRLIAEGRVSVNGCVVKEVGTKVDVESDYVLLDGQLVELNNSNIYIMLNKPAGYLSTMRDPFNRPCVADLVPCNKFPGLFSVGRLDLDTTGLLLFTTDGETANKLLHPSFEKTKTYIALIDGKLSKGNIVGFKSGLVLDDFECAPADIIELSVGDELSKAVIDFYKPGNSIVSITIHEGRFHQVKRMFEAVGHDVIKLHRASFDSLDLRDLPEGEWRYLTEDEICAIRSV